MFVIFNDFSKFHSAFGALHFKKIINYDQKKMMKKMICGYPNLGFWLPESSLFIHTPKVLKCLPCVGFKEYMPLKKAGFRRDPPTSEPRPKIDPPEPIKEPSPPDEPPHSLFGLCALPIRNNSDGSVTRNLGFGLFWNI